MPSDNRRQQIENILQRILNDLQLRRTTGPPLGMHPPLNDSSRSDEKAKEEKKSEEEEGQMEAERGQQQQQPHQPQPQNFSHGNDISEPNELNVVYEYKCSICTIDKIDTYGAPCGHLCCRNCWDKWLLAFREMKEDELDDSQLVEEAIKTPDCMFCRTPVESVRRAFCC